MIIIFFSLCGIKMEQKVLTFDKQYINKNTFYKNKIPISIDKEETRRLVFSKNGWYSKKGSFNNFVGYVNETDAFLVASCIKLAHMNGYVKYFDSNSKGMNLLLLDEEMLNEYNEICDKISNLLEKGLVVNQCILTFPLNLR